MYKGIFDSHAHYDEDRFDSDRAQLLTDLHAQGVEHIINIGANLERSQRSVELAERYDFFYATVGTHPSDAHRMPPDYIAQLRAMAAGCPKVVAVGEIGLDYYYETDHMAEQKQVFREQLELARELLLPVVIHDRDAHADTMEVLREYRPAGVVHCYSGSAEMAQELVQLGMYIGFTGVVTFKNARRALEAAAAVPLERLLIETDCPYLAPEPFRGQRCHSGMLAGVVDKLAEVKGVSPQELVAATNQNAKRLFDIS